MTGNSADPILIFVHISKSAGSTLNRVIDWEYNPLRICSVDGRFYFWSYQQLQRWRANWFENIDVVRGHMPFGLHRRIDRPASYLTIVRDPVDRIISEYSYRQISRTHPLAYRSMRGLSLEEYVTTLPYNNLQTKMIAGIDTPYDFYSGTCTVETLEIAKNNLRCWFSVVGLTERFEETLALASVMYGWKTAYYTPIRRTRNRPKKEAVEPIVQSLIAERNRFDLELYKFAVELFDNALRRHEQGVRAELERMQESARPSRCRSLCYRCGSVIKKQTSRIVSDLYNAYVSLGETGL